MPKVPTQDAFQAALAGPQAQRIGLTPTPSPLTVPDLATPVASDATVRPALTSVDPSIAGRAAAGAGAGIDQLSDFSKSLTDAGDNVSAVALDVARQTNVLRVNDALNQVKEARLHLTYDKEAGFSNLKGLDALQRPDGKPLASEYVGKLDENISTLRSGLTNDTQRQMFDLASGTERVAMDEQATAHEAQQFQEYNLSVQEGTVATSLSDLEKNYTNPDLVASNVERIKGAVYARGKLLGKSATWIESQQNNIVSKAHAMVVGAALEQNNIAFADAYSKAHAKDMNGDDLLHIQGLITKEVDGRMGLIVAGDVMRVAQPQLAPTDFDRMVGVTMGPGEGTKGADRDIQGKLITSPKGAKGSMQVMDATMQDPGLPGVKPLDPATATDAQRAQFGKDYLHALLIKYDGDRAKTWAAYNAGYGAVDDAVKSAKDGNWLGQLPKETQDYVQRTTAAWQAGAGSYKQPDLGELMAKLRDDPRMLDSSGQLVPERLRQGEAELSKQFEQVKQGIEVRKTNALGDAYSQLIANKGNFMSLPTSVRSSIPPEKLPEVMEFAGKIAKGVPATTDWSLYYALKQTPQALGAANLMAYRDKLSDEDFKQLSSEQADIRAGKQDNMTHVQTAKDVLDNKLRAMGINTSPKAGDTNTAGQLGQAYAEYQKRINAEEARTGKKLSSDEMGKLADQLTTQVKVSGNGRWWAETTPEFNVKPGDKVVSVVVPPKERSRIEAALRANKKPVTDQAVQQLYARAQGISN